MPRKKAQPVVEVKARKAYPDRETRIAMADAAIARLEKLNASRRELIEKTEAKLAERKLALSKSEKMCENAKARKERLIAVNEKTPKTAARARKAAEKAGLEELKAAIEASGKTVAEFLAGLNS